MASVPAVIRYTITRHRRLEGVGLSKSGHWGGKRYPSDEAAVAALQLDAGAARYTIERETR